MTAKADAIVLGGGIAGVSTAIHLRRRGLSVTLVDRRKPGEETSHGNAGIIQREGVHPYLFPRDIGKFLGVALKRRCDANYHLSSLFHVAPFLWRYFRASDPSSARRTMEANIPLFARCLETHEDLMSAAGSADLIVREGWIRMFRSDAALRAMQKQVDDLRGLGLDAVSIGAAELRALEPHVNPEALAGVVHYRDPWTCSDPGALVKSYARLFETLGGEIAELEVSATAREATGWRVSGSGRELSGEHLVIALGPWSKGVLDDIGVLLPMGIKRGYSRHYAAIGNAFLTRPLVDDENGFVMAPMARGIRVTSGAEFACHDARRTPVQLERALPLARNLLPLGESVDPEPWMGVRPVFPDMLPVVGAAPGKGDLWLNFGHGHHGFTLGPATGELLAQMMTGETPYCDPAPYSAARFG